MRIRSVVLAGTAGAAVTYLFDPANGGARRRRLRSSVGKLARLGHRRTPPSQLPDADGEPTVVIGPAGIDVTSLEPLIIAEEEGDRISTADADDASLVREVRSVLDERRDLRADELVIDVVNGVVYLAGDLPDRQTFGEVVDAARTVPGVRRVQSLLHLPPSETITRPARPDRDGV